MKPQTIPLSVLRAVLYMRMRYGAKLSALYVNRYSAGMLSFHDAWNYRHGSINRCKP